MDRPRGQRTVDAIKATEREAELFVTDVSSSTGRQAKAVVGRFGRVDVLVNNVAISDTSRSSRSPRRTGTA
jgi:NAD(P)-dependent dehydrogenase (short-subunit alcohol dehydrogenase family)